MTTATYDEWLQLEKYLEWLSEVAQILHSVGKTLDDLPQADWQGHYNDRATPENAVDYELEQS